jgi:hypothetical protein
MVKEDRVCGARVRTPQENDISLLGLPIRTRASARSKYCRQTDDAGSVSRPVATVDIVAANHNASELLRGEVHLVRAFRAAKQSKGMRTIFLDNRL